MRIAFLISVLIILIFSPIDSPNKRIDRNEKRDLCKIVFIIEIIICVTVLILENSKCDNCMVYHFRFMKAKKSQLLEKTERVKQQFLI